LTPLKNTWDTIPNFAVRTFYGCYPKKRRARSRGFTFIELLTVIAIISIMSVLAFAAFNSVKKAGDVSGASATISGVLEQARAYAMANNTFVFVGIEETNINTPSTQPQTAGTGRVAVQAFSSNDGTANSAQANLTAIAKIQILNNIHLLPALALTTGNFSQRATAGVDNVASGFPTPVNTIVSGNFTFSQIIAFNAQGLVSIPTAASTSGLQYVEYDLEPTNGTTLPAATTNAAAIQVDTTMGAVNVFRP
jgi:prepilin-type N-terminal cleavage/methylation domain-containing protein